MKYTYNLAAICLFMFIGGSQQKHYKNYPSLGHQEKDKDHKYKEKDKDHKYKEKDKDHKYDHQTATQEEC